MANKPSQKVPINKKRFLEVLRLHNCSIRKLGEAYDQIERTEKTIRRCLDNGGMSPDLLDRIAKYLNIHPDYLSGVYDAAADRYEDSYFRALFKSFIKPERYPYFLKEQSNLGYISYFKNILFMNNISIEQFNTLPPEERILFRQEIDVAILEVIEKHFANDSLGNNLNDQLAYCKSFIGEYDPFSYYAYLEGIGLPEPTFSDDFPDNPETNKHNNP